MQHLSSATPVEDGAEQALLSAWMDGEGLDAWHNLEILEDKKTWNIYHLIGDTLRSADLAIAPSLAFQARLSLALAHELPMAVRPRQRRFSWFQGGWGRRVGFAAVAVLILLIWVAVPHRVDKPAPLRPDDPIPVKAIPVKASAGGEDALTWNDYVTAHRQLPLPVVLAFASASRRLTPLAPIRAAATPGNVLLAPAQAHAFLTRAQHAAEELDYAGVFTYQEGETMRSSRIVHVVDGSGVRERVESLDHQRREYYRHHDAWRCLLPDRKMVLTQVKCADPFPGLLIGAPDAITASYRVSVDPNLARVAGRPARLAVIEPLHQDRYGYRLWLDEKNHLALKKQTLSSQHKVVEQVAFTALQLEAQEAAEQLPSSWRTKEWQTLAGTMSAIDVSKQGWRIPLPPAFRVAAQVARPLRSGQSVSHVVLSDGLAVISLFIEPYDKKRNSSQFYETYQHATLNVYAMRIANFWLTALGAIPGSTLEQLVKATQYVPAMAVSKS